MFQSIKVFTAIFLLLFGSELMSQQVTDITLNWGEPEVLVIGEDQTVMAPSFSGCRYLDLPGNILPFVSLRINLPPGSQNVIANIRNVVYTDFTKSDKSLTAGYEIPSAPEPNATVMKEKGEPVVLFSMLPFGINPENGQLSKVLSFSLELIPVKGDDKAGNEHHYASNSVLSTGEWFKVSTGESGIYKITYNDLKDLGVNMDGLNPDNIRLFGNGGALLEEAAGTDHLDDLTENAILVETAIPGVFSPGDYILFYAKGTRDWKLNPFIGKMEYKTHFYDDRAFYFLTIGSVAGKRIAQDVIPAGAPGFHSTSYTACMVYENDRINLIKSGRKWFGEKLDYYNREFSLPVWQMPDMIPSEPVLLNYGMAAKSSVDITFNLLLNGQVVATHPISRVTGNYAYANECITSSSVLSASTNLDFVIKFNPSDITSLFWIDFVSLNVRCNLRFSGGQMAFRDPRSVGPGMITSFTMSDYTEGLKLWDVSDPVDVKSVAISANGNQCTFTRETSDITEMVAFDGTSFMEVTKIGKIKNQDLHATGNYDMIIVTHPDFMAEAQRLASLHNGMGDISALVVSLPEIYNEFSSGTQDITAIRDFMKMLYDRGSGAGKPSYLLFFGTASYDVKNRLSINSNFVPTYQSENSISLMASFLTDDYFGLLDDGEGSNHTTGLLDVATGRLPVRTPAEAKTVVDKIAFYLENSGSVHGDWRNTILLIADDEDKNEHFKNAEKVAARLLSDNPVFNTEKIYFDAYTQQSSPGGNRYPDVNREITTRVEKGALITNYIGHGGDVGWAHERVLEINDINRWTNYNRMGLFFTATCEFSRFDNPDHVSAGELVFLNPEGGAMAMFTTTRLAVSGTNSTLNLAFIDSVFKTHEGIYPRMGDVLIHTKNQAQISVSTRNLTLFGDPAMRLPYPRYNIVTTSVSADTLFANTLVTVEGEVRDTDDLLLNGFDGILQVKVYDKPSKVRTLGQDTESFEVEFAIQKNIIYQGRATVSNGKFNFTFPVPADISYEYGNGKISYYASDGITDAHGYSNDIIIGGSVKLPESDRTGPEIRLFINDTTFISGGYTSENPVLLAYLNDESGINTVGSGIGHDIVAVIDGNSNNSVVMNDYYVSDIDGYQSGLVNYQYFNLPEGEHTLLLKAWDVFNNSSSAEITFQVKRNLLLSVDEVKAYPNPSSGDITFAFRHNLYNGTFTVELDIYSLNGTLVRTIGPLSLASEGYLTSNLKWDGRNALGRNVSDGMYLCRLRILDRNNHLVSKTVKVVLER